MKEIEDIEGLNQIKEHSNESYLLLDDIDASETKYYNNGKGFEPISYFKGVLDGNGHKIKNLHINRKNCDCGLISKNMGHIRNIIFESASVKGGKNIGVSVGYNIHGVIRNIVIKNSLVIGNKYTESSGALCGNSYTGTIINCDVKDSKIKGNEKVGGMIGKSSQSEIKKCSVRRVNVEGYLEGGLIGCTSEKERIGYSSTLDKDIIIKWCPEKKKVIQMKM